MEDNKLIERLEVAAGNIEAVRRTGVAEYLAGWEHRAIREAVQALSPSNTQSTQEVELVCNKCGAGWHSNDGKCHVCRRGEIAQPSTPTPQIDERAAIVAEALRKAGEAFRSYEAHHQSKVSHIMAGLGPVDVRQVEAAPIRAKVTRNRELAEMCEAAIEHTTALPTVPVDVETVARALCEAQGLDWDAQANFMTSASGSAEEQESFRVLARAALAALSRPIDRGVIKDLGGRIGAADRAGGLRPEPPSESQSEALIPCAHTGEKLTGWSEIQCADCGWVRPDTQAKKGTSSPWDEWFPSVDAFEHFKRTGVRSWEGRDAAE